jgi:hypothetical protein
MARALASGRPIESRARGGVIERKICGALFCLAATTIGGFYR